MGSVAYPSREVTLKSTAVQTGSKKSMLHDKMEEHCGLVQFYPGMSPDLIRAFEGYKGLVLAGTGLGHVIPHSSPPCKNS